MSPSEAAAALGGATAAAVAGPAAVWQHVDIGAPSNVILWISIGAAAGVMNRRIEHKGNLVGMFLMSFVLTIGVIVGFPQWTGYHWETPGYQAAMGLLLSFTAQNWGPQLLKAISKLNLTEIVRSALLNWLKPNQKPRRDDDDPR